MSKNCNCFRRAVLRVSFSLFCVCSCYPVEGRLFCQWCRVTGQIQGRESGISLGSKQRISWLWTQHQRQEVPRWGEWKTCACVLRENKIGMYCCSPRQLWNGAMFLSVNISLCRPFRPSQHSIHHLSCASAMSAPSSALLALPALMSHGLSCKQPLFSFLPCVGGSPYKYPPSDLVVLQTFPFPWRLQTAAVWEPSCWDRCLSL